MYREICACAVSRSASIGRSCILDTEQLTPDRQTFRRASRSRSDGTVGDRDEGSEFDQCCASKVEPRLRIVEPDPRRSGIGENLALGHAKARFGEAHLRTGNAKPRPAAGKIWDFLLDADRDLRGKLLIKFERGGSGHRKVHDPSPNARIRELVRRFRCLAPRLHAQCTSFQNGLFASCYRQYFLVSDRLCLGSLRGEQGR